MGDLNAKWINQSTIEHGQISGRGVNTHAQIDAHISNDGLHGGMLCDYLESAFLVPLHRQAIFFQRLTVATSGRLINQGRVRIL
jgi:hypothetical protein